MANWTLTGGLGSGKSIIAVGKLRDQMLAGLPAAGNLDIYPEHLLPFNNKSVYLRLPDFPSAHDLWTLGRATESKLEKHFGLLVLDELAVFLNSREWATKGRDEVIKYLRHVRKQHWHTLFITQDIESLDKQARIALVEHKAVCSRTDRLPIPFIGTLFKLIGLNLMLPKIHMAIVRYGQSDKAFKVATWTYHGKSLFKAYNTDQVFTDNPDRQLDPVFVPAYSKHIRPFSDPVLLPDTPREIIPTSSGPYSILSAWHLRGRYLTFWQRRAPLFYLAAILALLFFAIWFYFFAPVTIQPIKKPDIVQQQSTISYGSPVQSYYTGTDGYHYLKLNDGKYTKAFTSQIINSKTIQFLSDENQWHVYSY